MASISGFSRETEPIRVGVCVCVCVCVYVYGCGCVGGCGVWVWGVGVGVCGGGVHVCVYRLAGLNFQQELLL